MIWDTPIHSRRPIKDWLGDPDTGFSSQIAEIVIKSSGSVMKISPYDLAKEGRIILFKDFDEIGKVCRLVSAFSPYADYVFWVDGRGISNRLKNKIGCEYLECSWRQAYVIADLVIISDIAHKDDGDLNSKSDRREVEMLIDARQKKGNCVTVLIGPNTDLVAVSKYVAIRKALEGISDDSES